MVYVKLHNFLKYNTKNFWVSKILFYDGKQNLHIISARSVEKNHNFED